MIAVYARDAETADTVRRRMAQPGEGCIVYYDDLALVHALCDGRLDGIRLLILAADAICDSIAITIGRLVRIADSRVGSVRVLDAAERASLTRALTGAPRPVAPPGF